jgi:hypothetical protein
MAFEHTAPLMQGRLAARLTMKQARLYSVLQEQWASYLAGKPRHASILRITSGRLIADWFGIDSR